MCGTGLGDDVLFALDMEGIGSLFRVLKRCHNEAVFMSETFADY